MNFIFGKITLEKVLIYTLIAAVVITFGFIFYLIFGQFTKNIRVTSPLGGEEWGIGEAHTITWKSRGIDKVGIVLFQGSEAKWIAKNVPAAAGEYEWKIYPGQPYGDNYWIAVFEYPWRKGNKIAYSDSAFAVVFPELASCDTLSAQNEWPYLPSDLPGLRKVFITENTYNGDLDGLEGADKICQQEAQTQGYQGSWRAFLGGDSDQEIAIERLKASPRKTGGIFIEAKPGAVLLRGATCHRLLGKSFDDFLAKFSQLSIINGQQLGSEFFQRLQSVWLGRLDLKSSKNCITIALAMENPYKSSAEKYSLTATCQNWTKGVMYVDGYPVPLGGIKPPFPTCYTAQGKITDAAALAGRATGLTGGADGVNAFTPYQGKSCDVRQRLLCIED